MKQYYDEILGRDFSLKIDDIIQAIGSEQFDPIASTYGIEGSTFRAFRGYSLPPSKIYREWAGKIAKPILEDSNNLEFNSQSDFDRWHNELSENLTEQWNARQKKPLNFAHTFKIVDLFLKWLLTNEKCPKDLSKSILKYGYCALDSKILTVLNKCLSGALPIRKPSMGDIQNINTYNFCQSLIKEFCEYYSGTRILFDYYAWKPGGGDNAG